MSIGENLKRLREEQDMTQMTLAERVCVSQPMIAQLERGTKTMTVPLALAIAQALSCTVSDLIGVQ